MSDKSALPLQQARWNVAQFFEQRWWKRYLNKRDAAEYLAWKKAYWEGILKLGAIPLTSGDRVLDAGTGPAGVQMILSEQEVTAIDPLLDRYRQLEHYNEADYPWTSFQQLAIEDLNVPEAFDYVFCMNVINHVVNLEASCDNLCQALRSGGQIVMSIDCHRYHWAQWFLKRIPLDVLHPHQLRLDEYMNLLKARGIKIEHSHRIQEGNLFDYWMIIGTKA